MASRWSALLTADDPNVRSNRASSVYSTGQTPEIQHSTHWPQRLSRSSILASWRLSRSTLDPDAIAVFDPLAALGPPPPPLKIIESQENNTQVPWEKNEGFKQETILPLHYDKDIKTRNLCILALVSGLCIGVAAIAIGTYLIVTGKQLLPAFLLGKYITLGNLDYPFGLPKNPARKLHYLNGHRIFSMPQWVMILTSLALNTCLTIIFDAMSYIPSTTLRWALWREDRLVHNSNPRLFIGARHFAPNSRCVNLISAFALILGYGSTSLVVCNGYIAGTSSQNSSLESDQVSGQRWALDFSGWSMVGAGSALILQGLICVWCLVCSGDLVKTWSSNPLSTARACAMDVFVSDRMHETPQFSRILRTQDTFSTIDLDNTQPLSLSTTYSHGLKTPLHLAKVDLMLSTPLKRQPPARICVPQARKLVLCVWLVFTLLCITAAVIGALGKYRGACSASTVMYMSYRLDFLAYFQTYCQVSFPFYKGTFFNRRDWLGVIFQSLALAIITLGLHCVELITEINRDEAIWRKLTTSGRNPDTGAIAEGATSWQCWVLFLFKCVTPWIFSYAFSANLFVAATLIPMCFLAVLFLLLALFAEALIRHKPKGAQPATYGNIKALIALVDEWDHKRLFWGDKGMATTGIRIAGTAGQRLADLDPYSLYTGLQVQR